MLEDGVQDPAKSYCSNVPFEEPRCCFTKLDDAKLFCCRCAHKRKASPLTCLAICFLVLTYNLLGGFLFLALEGNVSSEESVAASKPNLSQTQGSGDLRSKTVERLWSITEDLNILYKENWTKLAAKELMDFQKVLMKTMKGNVVESRMSLNHEGDYRWTFSSSFLYALTLITTIGHGGVSPRSLAGRALAVLYACGGIPLVMLYLSTLGAALARNVRVLYSHLRPRRARPRREPRDVPRATPFQAALNLDALGPPAWTCRDHTRVPVPLSVLLVALYVALGTLVFRATEKWSVLDGCYFSFSSLATIGFGDLRPGAYASRVSAKAEDVALGVCCVYILVGMVVVAMCFDLIREDTGAALRSFTALCGGASKARAVHSAEKLVRDEEKLDAAAGS